MDRKLLAVFADAVDRMFSGFEPLSETHSGPGTDEIARVLYQAADRMKDNYPYHHPLYAGQMLKPPHVAALLSYALAMFINPNNHALDGGIASSRMEKEALSAIASMFGWTDFLGHLTSGGTMANLEALWISGRVDPKRAIAASDQAHYTHRRISDVLKLDFEEIPSDPNGVMDIRALEQTLKQGRIGTVVVTMGTTGCGKLDPLADILELRAQYGFRVHVDAAYGGYFKLAGNLSEAGTRAFDHLHLADSIVVDPHKHGLQPYGCGCILFRDPGVGRYYRHDSPYTYFTSEELHLGEISLECSRAGASAVALWTTLQLFPLVRGGEFAANLEKSRHAALRIYEWARARDDLVTFFEPDLDILVFSCRGNSSASVSEQNRAVFRRCAQSGLHLALMTLPRHMALSWRELEWDSPGLVCLRSCLMKPEHDDRVEQITAILEKAL